MFSTLARRRRPVLRSIWNWTTVRSVDANRSSVRRHSGYVCLTTAVDSLPASFYFDPGHHQLEMTRIWYRNWIYVCRSSDIGTPRTFRTLEVGDQSILVVRGV